MRYNPERHHRRSIRLKGYDYSQAGLYFLTLCTQDRACLFGKIIDGEMLLNPYGDIAYTEWQKTEVIRDNCRIHETIVMPNHLHGIIEITFKKGKEQEIGKFQSPTQTIGSIIRGFKIATIKRIKDLIQENNNPDNHTSELQFAPTEKIKSLDFKIWQRNYWEHIIRNDKAYHRISEYIINNPRKWQEDSLKNK